jgi:hypothetical protein
VPFLGYLSWRRTAERIKVAPSETAFYWTFYAPMMEVILDAVETR